MPADALPLPAPTTTPVRHRGMWAWPFVLALTFATAVGAWLQWSDEQEREEDRRTLIADVLTLESRISDWLAAEDAVLATLARTLPAIVDEASLLREPAVVEGLRRMWISVTVIDRDNRLLAHVPPLSRKPQAVAPRIGIDEGNLSAHLAATLQGGGHLIARFAPAALLRQTVPWWLSRKYDVRLVDEDDQRIASTGDPLPTKGRQSYRVSLEPRMGNALLELTIRDIRKPWWRGLAMVLMAVFLLLSAAASWMLRRQMREVSSAEIRWRTEVAWRRAIEDSLTVGLRGRDTEGRLVHVNRAFCDLVGLPPEQLVGQLPPMPYWLPDTFEDHMQRHLRTLAGAAPREGYEARWLHSNGNTIDVMVFESPLIDATGRHIGWMGSIVDITERKRSEERERRQLETLGNHARLTTLGEVASALAHQLNQPLAAVAGYNAGVLRSLERSGLTDAVVLDAVRRMGEQVAEAGNIVQRIRGFLTRRAPQREPCQLDDIVRRAVTLLQRDLARRHIRLETVCAQALPTVLADPILVEQVVINLVRNAADALADTSAPTIRITLSTTEFDTVCVAVDDNGTGLGGRSVAELAAPFHSTKADGMGMGLAICRSIIEAHHGTLEAGSSAFGGACFSFTLPVDPAQ